MYWSLICSLRPPTRTVFTPSSFQSIATSRIHRPPADRSRWPPTRPERSAAHYVQPAAVGETLPAMPLFLASGFYVNFPLEPTYTAAFAGITRRTQDELNDPAK